MRTDPFQVVLLPLRGLAASLAKVSSAGVHVEAKLFTLAAGIELGASL